MSEKNSVLKTIRNSALIKNPLLFEAIGLCPVVAIAHSLRLALFLAIITTAELVLSEVLTSLLLKNVKRCWRVMLYVIFGVGIIFPIMYLIGRFLPDASANIGVYLPLMAVNSLIALHCERVAVKNDVKTSFIDAVSASLSYGAVTIIVGLLREFFSFGTIGGLQFPVKITMPAFAMPFGGLLIIGFLAAALKAFINAKFPNASPDRAFDMSEISRSLRGSWRELEKDAFNPYGDTAEDEEATVNFGKGKALIKKIKKEKKKKVIAETKVETNLDNTIPLPDVSEIEKPKTYVDEFSDILSDLEEYKARNNDGGDEQ